MGNTEPETPATPASNPEPANDGAVVLEPSSDPAAQREVAAAPAEPAAGSETSTPPAMTKEEAAVRLCGLAAGTDDPATLRALLLGCKALCREGLHKRRNKASRSARGL